MSRIHEYLARGIHEHQRGRIIDAERFYRRVLTIDPNQTDALHLMGVVHSQNGHHAQAARLIGRAIQNNPIVGMFHNSLGNALKNQGQLEEAAESYRQALQLDPDLGEAHFNLATILATQSQWELAEKHCQTAHRLLPHSVEICNLLASLSLSQREYEKAIDFAQKTLSLAPNHAEAFQHIGSALFHLGRADESIQWYRRAISQLPDDPAVLQNLAMLNCKRGQLDQALPYIESALARDPSCAEAWNTLGNIRKEMGRIEEAVDCYRKAAELNRINPTYLSNAIYTLLFLEEALPSRVSLSQAAKGRPSRQALISLWNELFATPWEKDVTPHTNSRVAGRPLRIGYVSSDFRSHPVGRFVLPLLEHHDRTQFEVFGYSSVKNPDGLTKRTKESCTFWRECAGWNTREVANAIRRDKIDILIDLGLHLGYSRLEVFALKPAPVQVSYIAYPGSSGLPTIDYYFTDRFQHPGPVEDSPSPNQAESLGDTWACYHPINETAPVTALPALKNGFVTFGCLNHYCKVTPRTLGLWARILAALPDSRIKILSAQGSHREEARQIFAERGVAPTRIEFVERKNVEEYFALWGQCDLGLDTYPYPGIRTSCDALWMGVPIVALAGHPVLGRAGIGPLHLTGLSDWVATDEEAYVRIAMQQASDLIGLAQLRAGLRARMGKSPLMDAPSFARKVEASYQKMWRRWCEHGTRTNIPQLR
jgi:protein O-GlcNAc transferase